MADLNPAGRQHFLDHAQAQGKPKVQPHDMADDLSRETVAGMSGVTGRLISLLFACWSSPAR
jgi:hypothetical protein